MPDADAAATLASTATTTDTPRTLPDGWRWVPLGDLCDVIAGQSPTSDTYSATPEGLPFFQGKADFGRRHPVARVWCTAPIKIAQSGDILISVRAPVGPTNVADVECCIGRGLAAIRPTNMTDVEYLLHALRHCEPELSKLGSGSTFSAITMTQLTGLLIPLPSLAEQRRIAAILAERMAAVERARAAAEAQLGAAKALPAAELRVVFESEEAQEWPRARLGDVASLLPSKSIATTGDTEVSAITTACLTEQGFNPRGVKPARMWAADAAEAAVEAGEVLIARSNTAELVGRAALYQGVPEHVVASDLTIRLYPSGRLSSSFLAAQLSALFVSGYWRERAGGASGSMKKITRTQLADLDIPLPSNDEQQRVGATLDARMAEIARLRAVLKAELDAINALPAALLRQAFNGEL